MDSDVTHDIKFYFSDSCDESNHEDAALDCNDENRQLKENEDKKNDSDDSPLHSLEAESHGPTIQQYISKYMDHGFDESLTRETKKRKEKENFGRTLKVAAQQTLNQRVYFNKESSQSANSLTILLSSASSSDSSCSSPTHLEPNSSQVFFHSSVKCSDAVDKLELRRKKHWNKKRTIERDRKTGHVNYDALTPSPVEIEKLFIQEENEMKNFSVNSKQSFLDHRSSVESDCPVERIQFYKTFSLLIRMGNREKQSGAENENKIVNEDQLSFQAIKDCLWLELKAWHNGSTICDEKRTICLQRQSIPEVLKEILNFTILDISENVTNSTDSGYVSCGNVIIDQVSSPFNQNSNEDISAIKYSNVAQIYDDISLGNKVNDKETRTIRSLVKSLEKSHKDSFPLEHNYEVNSCCKDNFRTNCFLGDACSCNEALSRLCQNCINNESEALHQVTKVLEKLDEVEHYYSCSKALGNEYPVYNSEEFIIRVKTLNLWLNLTQCLRRKIDSLAKLFGIRDKLKAGWPCYDFNEIQRLVINEEDKNQNNDKMESKHSLKVNFQNISDFTSSPNTTGSDRGCCSTSASPDVQNINPFDLSVNNASFNQNTANLDIKYFKSSRIYHRYVDKTLRHKGLKYIYSQLTSVLRPILFHVHAALKRPKPTSYAAAVAKVVTDSPNPATKFSDAILLCPNKEYCEELSTYGVWSDTYQKMRLPTFHRPFLFLLRIPLDIVHECLQLRIQQQPEDPSSLSIYQLIKECKEVLRAGIQMRQRYINLAQTIFGEDGSDVIEAQLNEFDKDLKTMLQVISHLCDFIYKFI
ncbi:mitogen-activated protein kinase kinase kinase 4-like [Centruroides sculpturatus]|uniref:mitogen-activated protein kinase kinase kinase 4-like n=1 Tax=Centruroides sculpturatus TaxID=218467 RepID=UPI000C6CFF0F|nr:mitogen-activated protein kinase kinase kinase 4-like [Centruroides sculpturatus]